MKNQKEFKDFLSKIVTAQSITQELREEALRLRDIADISIKKNVWVIGFFEGDTYVTVDDVEYQLDRIEIAATRARRNDGTMGKVQFIKEIRAVFSIGVRESLHIADELGRQGRYTYGPPDNFY